MSLSPNGMLSDIRGRPALMALMVMAVLLPVVIVPVSRALVVVVALGALLAVCDRAVRGGVAVAATPSRALLVAVAPLLGWAAMSLVWTLDPGAGVHVLVRLLLLTAAAAVLVTGAALVPPESRPRLFSVMIWSGVGLALALIVTQAYFRWGIHWIYSLTDIRLSDDKRNVINGAVATLAVLSWPLMRAAFLRTNLVGAGLLALLIVAALALGFSRSPLMGWLVGAVGFTVVRLWGAAAVRPLIAVAILLSLATPWAMRQFVATPWYQENILYLPWDQQHRLRIWDFASSRIADRPLIGWGLDSSRIMPGASDPIVGVRHLQEAEQMPLHPHNGVMQLWLELGVVGILMWSALLVAMGRAISGLARRDRWGGAFAAGVALTFGGQMVISFGVWQNWWLSVAVLGLIYCVAVQPRPERWR